MPQLKSKKIFFYVFLFLIIGTLNNKDLSEKKFFKVNKIEISGLSDKENLELINKLKESNFSNLLVLNKLTFKKFFDSINTIEEFSVFKKYPSTLNIELKKTNFVAYLNKQGKNFFIGSNGKLIETNNTTKKLPFVLGNLDVKEFFIFKKKINQSNFNYQQIKKLFFFPSGRWDIETQSGILIKLSKDDLQKKLELIISILQEKNFKDIKIIDLRQNNQVIIDER